jgi:hypothetical protein
MVSSQFGLVGRKRQREVRDAGYKQCAYSSTHLTPERSGGT